MTRNELINELKRLTQSCEESGFKNEQIVLMALTGATLCNQSAHLAKAAQNCAKELVALIEQVDVVKN